MKIFVSLLFCALVSFPNINGHGRLLIPPGRSTAWREGFNTPANYNDNELNCGGFNNQWSTHDGKCGLCGDPFQGPRDNEAGGLYATGTIVREYTSGSVIDVTVQITSNHKGYHQFRLCNHNDPSSPITQECLDEHLLPDATYGNTDHTMGETNADYTYRLQLPAGLTCTQCVLQWKYNAGNSWGVDPDTGEGAVGLGPQEQFYGCADVRITGGSGSTTPQPATTTYPATGTQRTTTYPATGTQRTTTYPPTGTQRTTTHPGTTTQGTTRPARTERTTRPPPTTQRTTRPTTSSGTHCVPTELYEDIPDMKEWCATNCALGNCPATHCVCTNKPRTCVAAAAWNGVLGVNDWCRRHCNPWQPVCQGTCVCN